MEHTEESPLTAYMAGGPPPPPPSSPGDDVTPTNLWSVAFIFFWFTTTRDRWFEPPGREPHLLFSHQMSPSPGFPFVAILAVSNSGTDLGCEGDIVCTSSPPTMTQHRGDISYTCRSGNSDRSNIGPFKTGTSPYS